MKTVSPMTDAGPGSTRIRLRTIAHLFLALASAASAFAQQPDDNDRALVVSGSRWIADAPTNVAAAAGFFDDPAGRPIVVELVDSGKASLERLKAGRADFALMAGVPLAMELLRLDGRNAPREQWPVVLAAIGLSNSTHHVIASGARGIERPADLEGRALALVLGSSAHYGWDLFARFHRIDQASVRLVDTAPDRLGEELAAGRVDAVVAWTPFSERITARLGGDARAFPLESMDSVSWLLVSRRAVVDAYPSEVQRVLGGYSRAIELLQSEPARAERLMEYPLGWAKSGRVAWKLALDWPALFNIEQKLAWSADLLGFDHVRLRPRDYIDREPLRRFRPEAITLPLSIPAEDWIRAEEDTR